MRVLLTGADGFVGRNLRLRLAERKDLEVVSFTRADGVGALDRLVNGVDVIFHLAGVNRPQCPDEFMAGNFDLTAALVAAIDRTAPASAPRLVYASSRQATQNNAYGCSKLLAEDALRAAAARGAITPFIFRLPNVFGKWCRPNYNSVVATFCHNIARNLPIQINDESAPVTLVYIDDVVDRFLAILDGEMSPTGAQHLVDVQPEYGTTVGEISRQIHAFRQSRDTLVSERVGTGLARALYSTYVSYLPVESFSYQVARHADPRGVFVEMLKTPDCGQFSFFTAHPGVTRGGHYHHTKTEKFLVIKGQARFKFRHMDTGQAHELICSGHDSRIVETVPGWTHDITNIGDDEMVVMLWANEIFDRVRPDTVSCPL